MSNFCLLGEMALEGVVVAVLGNTSEFLTGVVLSVLAILELEDVELNVTADETVDDSSGGNGVPSRSSKLTASWGLRNTGPDYFFMMSERVGRGADES